MDKANFALRNLGAKDKSLETSEQAQQNKVLDFSATVPCVVVG
jgi:hypothetical protein